MTLAQLALTYLPHINLVQLIFLLSTTNFQLHLSERNQFNLVNFTVRLFIVQKNWFGNTWGWLNDKNLQFWVNCPFKIFEGKAEMTPTASYKQTLTKHTTLWEGHNCHYFQKEMRWFMMSCHNSGASTVMGSWETPGGRGCACVLCSASMFDCTLNITKAFSLQKNLNILPLLCVLSYIRASLNKYWQQCCLIFLWKPWYIFLNID